MSIETQKISQSEKEQYSVKSIKGNQLTGTVEENKNVFDRQTEMLIDKYNALIDSVLDGSAAAEIGAVSGEGATKVQTILSDLLERTQTAENTLLDKVDKITGKGLSTHDYDDTQTHGNKPVLDAITELSQSIVKASPNAVPSVAAIVSYVQNMGGGDMARAMYDRTQSGVVDDAERLGGELPGYYATSEELNAISSIPPLINGYATDLYLYVTGNHPLLNAGVCSEYDMYQLSKYRGETRNIQLSGSSQTITVYDGFLSQQR